MPGKRVQFDDETWQALDLLARDRMMDFQELADEAFSDLLKKHGRLVGPDLWGWGADGRDRGQAHLGTSKGQLIILWHKRKMNT